MAKLFFYLMNMGNNHSLLWYAILHASIWSYDIGKKCIVLGCTMTCTKLEILEELLSTEWWKGCKHTTTQFIFKALFTQYIPQNRCKMMSTWLRQGWQLNIFIWRNRRIYFESRASVFHCLGIISTYFILIAMIIWLKAC